MSINEQNARQYLEDFMAQRGINPDTVYSPEDDAWYFRRGSASLEVFFVSYETSEGTTRTFIRFFSPLIAMPTDNATKFKLFSELMVLNSKFMGVKFAATTNQRYIYSVYERDIEGMSYEELEQCMEDSGYWGDYLDDYLKDVVAEMGIVAEWIRDDAR